MRAFVECSTVLKPIFFLYKICQFFYKTFLGIEGPIGSVVYGLKNTNKNAKYKRKIRLGFQGSTHELTWKLNVYFFFSFVWRKNVVTMSIPVWSTLYVEVAFSVCLFFLLIVWMSHKNSWTLHRFVLILNWFKSPDNAGFLQARFIHWIVFFPCTKSAMFA